MSTKIVPSVTLEHCPRCAGFLVEDVLFDGSGWSNFSVLVVDLIQKVVEALKVAVKWVVLKVVEKPEVLKWVVLNRVVKLVTAIS